MFKTWQYSIYSDETWTTDAVTLNGDNGKYTCIAWERGYCIKYCMEWQIVDGKFACEDLLIMHVRIYNINAER